MENWTSALFISIISAVIAVIGAIVAIYKAKPERRKIEAEGLASIALAAGSVAEGAKVSTEQLLKRIEEMEVRDHRREQEMEGIKNELSITRAELNSVMAVLVEWKEYAFRLAHQVKSLGGEPVSFKVTGRDISS